MAAATEPEPDARSLAIQDMGRAVGVEMMTRFVVPFEMPVNHWCEGVGLVVTDVFGDRTSERGGHEPNRIDALAPAEGQRAERDRAEHRDHGPQE